MRVYVGRYSNIPLYSFVQKRLISLKIKKAQISPSRFYFNEALVMQKQLDSFQARSALLFLQQFLLLYVQFLMQW